jgi:hypothetical protein
MGNLICPKCDDSGMTWLDPEMDRLLEEGIMKCDGCGAEFKGIPGWQRAMRSKRDRQRHDSLRTFGPPTQELLQITCDWMEAQGGGTVGTEGQVVVVRNAKGKAIGVGMTHLAALAMAGRRIQRIKGE